MKKLVAILIIFSVFLSPSEMVLAGEFRSMVPIAGSRPADNTVKQLPAAVSSLPGLPDSADLEKLTREARNRAGEFVRQGMTQLFEAWNSGQIDKFISPRFYDRQRFLDALLRDVPRDAQIRLLAIESVQPFDQVSELLDPATGAAPAVVPEKLLLRVKTKVTAVVRTQLEYNDARLGFQRREGRNEFHVELAQDIPLVIGR